MSNTGELTVEELELLTKANRRNVPQLCRERLVGFVLDEGVAGLSDGLFLLDRLLAAARRESEKREEIKITPYDYFKAGFAACNRHAPGPCASADHFCDEEWRAFYSKPPVPEQQQQGDADSTHDWFQYREEWESCRVCGIVRRADRKNKPCKGPVRVTLRDEYTEGQSPPTEAAPMLLTRQERIDRDLPKKYGDEPSPQGIDVGELLQRIGTAFHGHDCEDSKGCMLCDAASLIERQAAEIAGEKAIASGWHKRWKALKEQSMPIDDVRNLDDVVHELGIEDSDTTPTEAVRELKAEIERLHSLINETHQKCYAIATAGGGK